MTQADLTVIVGATVAALVSIISAAIRMLSQQERSREESASERHREILGRLRNVEASSEALMNSIASLSSEGGQQRREVDFLSDRVLVLEKVAPVSVRADVPHGEGSERCPYCHDAMAAGACVVRCDRCNARHHVECYQEHGRCAVFACGSREAVHAAGERSNA